MNLQKVLGGIILCVLVSVADLSNTSCVTRRCLATMLIAKDLLSQPQSPSCDLTIDILSLQYTTILVDTKKMHFSSQLTLVMKWEDPDLSWEKRTYNVGAVVLPANKIWTPILSVENAVSVSSKPITNDVLVLSNGIVVYQVVMDTTVKCNINLFYYPSVSDTCLIPLNGRTSKNGCGVNLTFPGHVNMTGESTSEWITKSVELTGESSRNYLNVEMSVSIFNPTVSLILPSILLLLADVMSCLLPLGGGERNSFKVTLVLSFTMFLLQLTQTLPDSESCSPLLRYHYLVSLLLMLQSMLSSMVLTRMAGGCGFLCCLRSCKKGKEDNLLDWTHTQQGKGKVIDGNQDNTAETIKDNSLESMAYILKVKRQQEDKDEKDRAFAEKLDLALFLVYITLCVIYGLSIAYITTLEFCTTNNSVTWSDDYDDIV